MTAPRRLLLAVWHPVVRQTLRQACDGDGFDTLLASDLAAALEAIRRQIPDLAIVEMAGAAEPDRELVLLLRTITANPLLALVPRLESSTVVRLLDAGVDDCASRDAPPGELLARARALLRRAEAPPLLPRTRLTIDQHLTIDFSRALVEVDGQPVHLRPNEYRLLYHLASNPGRVLAYENLLGRVWGPEYQQEIHYVHLYATYLRKKLEPDPSQPRYIFTERGLGYRFVDYRQSGGNELPGGSH